MVSCKARELSRGKCHICFRLLLFYFSKKDNDIMPLVFFTVLATAIDGESSEVMMDGTYGNGK